MSDAEIKPAGKTESHLDGDKEEKTQYAAVLEIPPVESPQTAVRAGIASKEQK
jgi:hypothetical protein